MSFATHLPFPSPPSALPQSQVSSSPSTPTPTRVTGGGGGGPGCCENGRPVLTDPTTGQSVCSCQYSSALLGYSRLPGLSGSLFSPSSYSPGGPPTPSGYGVGLGAEGSAFYSPLGGAGSNLRDSTDAWRSLTQSTLYDTSPMGFYPYGGYGGLDLNARRKNATRESTNTLKAWLHEHIKNPYPTKGEKIMLAIITKMTLTQVSTWFANARRRLKKENKMTWSPRNRSEDGDDEDDDDEGGTAGDEGSASMKGVGGDKDREKEKRLNNEDIDVDGSSTNNTSNPATKYPHSSSKPLAGSDSASPTPSIAEDARSRLSPRDSMDSSSYHPTTLGDGHHHHHHPPHGHTTDLEGDQQKPKIWSVTDFLHPGASSKGVSSTEPSSCKETGMKMDTMRCVPTSAEAAAAAASASAVDLTGRTVSVGGGGNGSVIGVAGVTSASAAAAAHAHAAALSAAAAARGTAAGFFPPMTSLSPAQQLTTYQTALASYAAHSSGYGPPYGGLGSAMEMNKLVMKPTATRFGPYSVGGSKPGGVALGLVDSGFPPARDFSVLREGE